MPTIVFASPKGDAAEVPRLPHAAPGAARGAWQGRPDPHRLTRCASLLNPPLLRNRCGRPSATLQLPIGLLFTTKYYTVAPLIGICYCPSNRKLSSIFLVSKAPHAHSRL